MKKAYLVLADGTVFEGQSFGASAEAMGEITFVTSVVGYLETLSDPANCGRIVVQTFPQIGNYGVIESDLAGECRPAGYVVRDWCTSPSNFRCEGDIDAFLKKEGIPGICGVDTRALTRHLRENGIMNAAITEKIPDELTALCSFQSENPLSRIGRTEKEICPAVGETKYSVSVLDYGCGCCLVPYLTEHGCAVTLLPYTASAEEILDSAPDGVILSDGAGDPRENEAQIGVIRALFGKVQLMGVGLGHNMLALAAGNRVIKMRVCHHGSSYPVRDRTGSRTYLTVQNHAYEVDASSLTAGVLRYKNANDGGCEGIDYPDSRAFSVQFDPVLSAASRDTGAVMERFIRMMGGER